MLGRHSLLLSLLLLSLLLLTCVQAKDMGQHLKIRKAENCVKFVDKTFAGIPTLSKCMPKCLELEEPCRGISYIADAQECRVSEEHRVEPCGGGVVAETYTAYEEVDLSSTTSTTTTTTTTTTTKPPTTTPLLLQTIASIIDYSKIHSGYGTKTNAYDGEIGTKFCVKSISKSSYAFVKIELTSVTQLKEIILRGDTNYATGLSKLRVNVGLSSTPNMFRWEYGAVCCNPMSYTVDTPMEAKVVYIVKKIQNSNFCINEIELYGV